MPGARGLCQMCPCLMSEGGLRGCLPTFLGQCQTSPPSRININMQISVVAVVPEELRFFGSKFQEVFVTWGIPNASVRGSHLFPRSVTNLGQSIFCRCNCITDDGLKIWVVTKGVKSGSKLNKSSAFLCDPNPSWEGQICPQIQTGTIHTFKLMSCGPSRRSLASITDSLATDSNPFNGHYVPPSTFSSCYNYGFHARATSRVVCFPGDFTRGSIVTIYPIGFFCPQFSWAYPRYEWWDLWAVDEREWMGA